MTDEILQYPIGRFRPEAAPSPEQRAAWISDIAALPAQLRTGVAGLLPEAWDIQYRPGGWTVRQVVHHLADSHLNAYTRFRLGVTEDNPTIKPYDEKRWAELADVKHLPVDVSIRLLESLHERLVHLLRFLPEASFKRGIVHPENGPMTLDTLLSIYAWHGRHHVGHITALRERQGWA